MNAFLQNFLPTAKECRLYYTPIFMGKSGAFFKNTKPRPSRTHPLFEGWREKHLLRPLRPLKAGRNKKPRYSRFFYIQMRNPAITVAVRELIYLCFAPFARRWQG